MAELSSGDAGLIMTRVYATRAVCQILHACPQGRFRSRYGRPASAPSTQHSGPSACGSRDRQTAQCDATGPQPFRRMRARIAIRSKQGRNYQRAGYRLAAPPSASANHRVSKRPAFRTSPAAFPAYCAGHPSDISSLSDAARPLKPVQIKPPLVDLAVAHGGLMAIASR